VSAIVGIRDLLVRRDGKVVLQIEALTVERGQVTALVGPNAAGKTTLLLVLARLLKPERGDIWFDGKPVGSQGEVAYRRRIGLVMQDALLLDRSVFDNVSLGLRFRHLPKHEIHRRVDEWLSRLRIEHLRERPALKLSGGEAQRVALARAFVLEPELLLLDEPFRSLDEATRRDLLKDLKDLLPQGPTSTIFSSHTAEDLHELAQAEIVLRGGRLGF
jgi:tungstate transport system ATP-binding protein